MDENNLFSHLDQNKNITINSVSSNSLESNMVYSTIEFMKGFSWAIPQAYSDAIARCEFEEGDIFYDTPKAYEQWDDALSELNFSIQIKSPPGFKEAEEDKEEEGEGRISIFEKNWNAEIKIEITDYKQNFHEKRIPTTQGRLFSFLWHGNFEVLDINSDEPELPILVGRVKFVDASQHSKERKEKEVICLDTSTVLHYFKQLVGDEIAKLNMFIVIYDPTNNPTASKFRNIYNGLSADFSVNTYEVTPKECNLPNVDKLFPTITLKCIVIDSGKPEAIRDVIKEVLWPKKDSQKALRTVNDILLKGKRTSTRSFNLSRHGIFHTHKDKGIRDRKIITHSFLHNTIPYRYRLAINKIEQLPQSLINLSGFLKRLFTDCPNHLFIDSAFRVSNLDAEFNLNIIHDTEHDLINIAKESRSFEHCKSRHENLEKYMLDNDQSTIACEIPVWIEAGEFKNYYEVFKTERALTGHIDILRYESNGKIGVWDYKPKAYKEKTAKTQVFLYAFMLAVRTGRTLEDFVCGYFDEVDVFSFSPSDVKSFEL